MDLRVLWKGATFVDMGFKGQNFTWIGKSSEELIKERIDEALVNFEWIEAFPRIQVFNLPIIGSYHAPVLVDFDFRDVKGRKQFKFEILGMEKNDCSQIIKEGWSYTFKGSFAFKLVRKLKKCSRLLLDWSREMFLIIRRKLKKLKGKLLSCRMLS